MRMSENEKSVEDYTRRRIEASPLRSFFVINQVRYGGGNSLNSLDRPEDRRPTKETHYIPNET